VAALLIQISWKLIRKVALIISRSCLNMGNPVKNEVTGAKNKKNLVNTLVAAVLMKIFWKLVRKVVLMLSRTSLIWVIFGKKLGHRS
jgi:hypothetical protein